MYTTLKATREKALMAANAADRAIQRSICCKSQFKFKCFSCGEFINRGDNITTVHGGEGMTLRFRGSDGSCGLTQGETVFYQPSTGSKRWVHIGCNPCHWDSGGNSGGYGEPRLYGVWTDWGAKIEREFAEDYALTGRWDMEEFLERNGYPQEKFQTDRVKAGVTKFQALWRGYLYKQAYPISLRAARATEAINLNARATMSSKQAKHDNFPPDAEYWEEWRQSEKAQRAVPKVGDHGETLFDRKEKNEAIYSYEVTCVRRYVHALTEDHFISVKYHHDGEVRDYRIRRWMKLKKECEDYKKKLGIEATITGKLPTSRFCPVFKK